MSETAGRSEHRRRIGAIGRILGRGQTRREELDDPLAAVRDAVQIGGPFANSPIATALVHRDGRLIAANPSVGAIEVALRREPGVAQAVTAALDTGEVREHLLKVGRPGRPSAWWRAQVVPLAGGEAAVVQATDETRQRAVERALVESRQRFKDLVEISTDFAWEVGADLRFAYVSPRGALGYRADQLVGRRPADFLAPTSFLEAMSPFCARSRVADVELWFRRADEGLALLQVSALPLFAAHGAWAGARGVCRDITALHAQENSLKAMQRREHLVGFVLRRMQVDTDPARTLKVAARAIAMALSAEHCAVYRLTDRAEEALAPAASFGSSLDGDRMAQKLFALSRERGIPAMAASADRHLMAATTRYRRRVNGGILVGRPPSAGAWTADEVRVFKEVALRVGIVLEQLGHQQRLESQSRMDELTGLMNRRAFFADLEARIGGRRRAKGALLFVDLDNFKLVNDRHGHQRGDAALVEIAAILRARTRPGDLLARLGGDEFALWLEGAGRKAARARAEDLLAAASGLDDYTGDPARRLGFSVGIAVAAGPESDAVKTLADRADAAMYEAKRGGKGGIALAPPPVEPAPEPAMQTA